MEFILTASDAYLLYRRCHIGVALLDTLSELLTAKEISPELACAVVQQFDHSIVKAIRVEGRDRETFISGGWLERYNRIDDFGQYVLKDVSIYTCFKPIEIQDYLRRRRRLGDLFEENYDFFCPLDDSSSTASDACSEWSPQTRKKQKSIHHRGPVFQGKEAEAFVAMGKVEYNRRIRKMRECSVKIKVEHVDELIILAKRSPVPFVRPHKIGSVEMDGWSCRLSNISINLNPRGEYFGLEKLEEVNKRRKNDEDRNAADPPTVEPSYRAEGTRDYAKVERWMQRQRRYLGTPGRSRPPASAASSSPDSNLVIATKFESRKAGTSRGTSEPVRKFSCYEVNRAPPAPLAQNSKEKNLNVKSRKKLGST